LFAVTDNDIVLNREKSTLTQAHYLSSAVPQKLAATRNRREA